MTTTRRNFFTKLAALCGLGVVAAKLKPDPKFIANPDWVNAEYAIHVTPNLKHLLVKPPFSIGEVARYKATPEGTLRRVYQFKQVL